MSEISHSGLHNSATLSVDAFASEETIHILGAGSMGLLWATKLTMAGHPVDLITRKERKVRHVCLIESGSNVELDIDSYTASKLENINTLIVATKAYNALAAVQSVAHALGPDSKILVLQNGMGSQQAIIEELPHLGVYAAVSTDGARRHRPFVVEHTGFGQTNIGALSNGCDRYLQELLGRLDSDLIVDKSEDIRIPLWRKLVINCCINPLTAIYDMRNGELAEHLHTREMITAIVEECRLVAKAQNFSHALQGMEERVYEVIHNTAANYSSMHQDVYYKRETEIDFINGYIVAEAEKYGLKTPACKQLVDSIKAMPVDDSA